MTPKLTITILLIVCSHLGSATPNVPVNKWLQPKAVKITLYNAELKRGTEIVVPLDKPLNKVAWTIRGEQIRAEVLRYNLKDWVNDTKEKTKTTEGR